MPRDQSLTSTGYFGLLRRNQNYRRLLIGQVISQAGDWFNSVALFTLLLSLTGSGESVAVVLILKLLPAFFVGPVAGVVADRYDRKTIMIVSDVARGVLVLGFLLVRDPSQVWIIYLLSAAEIIGASFFDPAKSAALPNIVSRSELISANALSGATWSVTLALGAALGGVVTDAFGRDAAFIIDSMSFFVSAAFVSGVRIPRSSTRSERTAERRISVAEATGFADMIEGARYLKSNRRVIALLLVKAGWGLGGGVLLLLAIFGRKVFPLGTEGSTSIGLLYAARGTGAMIGPIIARAVTSSSARTMRMTIAVAFFISCIFYLLFSQASWLVTGALYVVGAHAGGSIQWVFSTTLLQLAVPDRFRGRVFALELALLTLSMSISTYLTGWGLDHAGLSERALAAYLGIAFIPPGLLWLVIQRWWRDYDAEQDGVTRPPSDHPAKAHSRHASE